MSRGRLVAACAVLLLLPGCSGSDPGPAAQRPAASPASPSATEVEEQGRAGRGPAYRPAYDMALSEPVEDSFYPDVGDPGVDALHYDLDLAWDPVRSLLTGRETVVFRAAESDTTFQLDLVPELQVNRVRLDGERVPHRQDGKDLVVEAEVTEDDRHVLRIRYSGKPGPVAAPTDRADIDGLGWTVTGDGSVWTLQEPFGAYSWYAVNDQPADKALYDFTLRVPAPRVGVANGELTSRRTRNQQTVTHWSLSEPASSYLVTVAFSDFETTETTSSSGVPMSVWILEEEADRLPQLEQTTVSSLEWVEEKLGPYPFDTLGFLFMQSRSGMETQTMISLGISSYTMSEPVLVHEIVHHWWGNQVTPSDWRDLWMNEGMALYLQALWESEESGQPLDSTIAFWTAAAQQMRDRVGPPGDPDPAKFADSSVYILTALMWHDIRERLGDEEFFALVREWPASHDNQNVDRQALISWWEQESGTALRDLFEAHLLGEQQP